MPRKQKVGLEKSATRSLLLNAAEELMREEGYAAVTSRRLGAHAGVKPQLVHYYFASMDELFIALYRRFGDKGLQSVAETLSTDHPLRALWAQSRNPSDVVLTQEFMALGNHRKAIRAESTKYGDELRKIQHDALERYFAERQIELRVPVSAIIVMLAGLGLIMTMESDAGMSFGHAEAEAFMAKLLLSLEASGDILGYDAPAS